MSSPLPDHPGDHDPRISDAERDEAVEHLNEHYVTGRLTEEELHERLDGAFTATHASDLAPLFEDLPAPRPRAIDGNGAHGDDAYGSDAYEGIGPHREPADPGQGVAPTGDPGQVPIPAPRKRTDRGRMKNTIRSVVPPVAFILWIFTGFPWWALLIAVVVTMVLTREDEGDFELPPEDPPPQLGPR